MIARTSSSRQHGTSLVEFGLSLAVRYAVVHGSDVNATPQLTTDVCSVFKNCAFGLNTSSVCNGTSGESWGLWPDAGASARLTARPPAAG
jgi:hypothetical protein